MGPSGTRTHARDHLTSVSVVTIAWRNERHAADFASSLAKAAEAAGEPLPEVVVVVNGPEGDAAGAIVSGRIEAATVRLGTNTGFSGGANSGVVVTTGEVVVVANLDVTFEEQFFSVLRREVPATWDLLAPRVLQGATGDESSVSRRTPSHRLAWVPDPPPRPGVVGGGNGACLVLRRSTMERRRAALGGLFDPEYHSFNEDIDLFWWVARQGLVVRYVPDLVARHALAGSFGGSHRFRDRPTAIQRRVMSNYRVTVWKNASGAGEWLGWPLGEAVYAGQAAVFGGLRGLGAYAASWPESVRTAVAIRRRRGRLRPPVSSRV